MAKNKVSNYWAVLAWVAVFLAGVITGMRVSIDNGISTVMATNVTGTVTPDKTALRKITTDRVNAVVRHITNAVAVTQVIAVYAGYSNLLTSPPVRERQDFENVEFSIVSNRYALPLSFPRWYAGAGVEFEYASGRFSPRLETGYRFASRWSAEAGISLRAMDVSITYYIK